MFILEGLEYLFFSLSETSSGSTTNISTHLLYSNHNFCPVEGGLMDSKLGSAQNTVCSVCKKNVNRCPGHFGYLKLSLPVFNIGYLKPIQIILQLICKGCSRILFKNEVEKKKIIKSIGKIKNSVEIEKINFLSKLLETNKENKICSRCHSVNGNIRKFGPVNFVHEIFLKNTAKNISVTDSLSQKKYLKRQSIELFLDPLTIFKLFQNIHYEDLELIDMNQLNSKPEHLLMCFLPIPPNNLRPSVFLGNSISNEDDLTIRLCEIYEINNSVSKNIYQGVSVCKLKNSWNLLQIEVSKYLNSELYSKDNSFDNNQGLYQRLKGKKGRFRGNLSGKRVDFSGRTVISPDPNIFTSHLGLPRVLAIKLTFPERVTKYNLNRLQRAVIRGSSRYPGANSIIDRKKEKTILNKFFELDKKIFFKEGVIVERHLRNNDIVLFNRQPSLHKISILGHRLKIIPGKTFRFSGCICKPYNADFDGDEMNIHVPQTQKARAEVISLMNSATNITSPRNGKSQIAAIQDFLTASFTLTSKDIFFNCILIGKFFVSDLFEIEGNLPFPCILKPKQLWSGKQIFSWIIKCPKNRESKIENCHFVEKNYSLAKTHCSPFMCPYDGYIVYSKGQLILGNIGKNSIGSENKISLLSHFVKNNSYQKLSILLLNLSKVAYEWFSNFGFSFGVSDIKTKKKKIDVKKKKFNQTFNLAQSLDFSFLSKLDNESRLKKLFSNLRNKLGKDFFLIQRQKKGNPVTMIECGSKGSISNLCQMSSFLGQQTIAGKRIKENFEKRNLPHFIPKKNNRSLIQKGFVKKNFFNGLSPSEYFFHSIGGREGLVDTAVKTAETGYIQRKLIKSLEDVTVYYDKTVRTSSGRLIQFKFGEDSINPEKISFLCEQLFFTPRNLKKKKSWKIRKLTRHESDTFCRACFLPPLEKNSYDENLRDLIFSMNKIIKTQEHINLNEIEIEIKKKKFFLNYYMVHPGNSIGALTAQSIGEPGTQMTLQTFHSAGATDTSITTGVARINEIINASKTTLTPIFIGQMYTRTRKRKILKAKLNLETIRLGNIVEKIELKFYRNNLTIEIFLKRKSVITKNIDKFFPKILKKIKNVKKIFKRGVVKLNQNKKNIKIQFKDVRSKKYEPFFNTVKIIHFFKNEIFDIKITGCAFFQKTKLKKNSIIFIQKIKLIDLIRNKNFHFQSIYSNDIWSIFEVLGIEAARQAIIDEINDTFGSHGIFTDLRYISVLADIMTYNGEIVGITRHGIPKLKTNILILASFEKTLENLFNASFKNSKDLNLGVSENIILGRESPFGTGMIGIKNTKNFTFIK